MKEYLTRLADMDEAQLQEELEELKAKVQMVQVLLSRTAPQPTSGGDATEFSSSGVACSTVITENDHRYGLLRFRGDSKLAAKLIPGGPIEILYKKDSYRCKIPAQAQPGRINALTRLYRENPEITPGVRVQGDIDDTGRVLRLTLEG